MLRKCPRCDKEITNDKLTHCPDCNNPLLPVPKKEIEINEGCAGCLLIVALCFIFFVLIGFCCSDLDLPSDTTTENINCSQITERILNNYKNVENFSENEELIIKGYNNGCNMTPNQDKYSELASNALRFLSKCVEKGDYYGSELYANKVIFYATQSNSDLAKEYISNALLDLAKSYYKQERYGEAKTKCLELLNIIKNNKTILSNAPVYELLADSELELGEKQNALTHYKRAISSYEEIIKQSMNTGTGYVPEDIINRCGTLRYRCDELMQE